MDKKTASPFHKRSLRVKVDNLYVEVQMPSHTMSFQPNSAIEFAKAIITAAKRIQERGIPEPYGVPVERPYSFEPTSQEQDNAS